MEGHHSKQIRMFCLNSLFSGGGSGGGGGGGDMSIYNVG